MTKWEYKSFVVAVNFSSFNEMTGSSSYESTLKTLGDEGWELAGMSPETDMDGVKSILFMFKRPKA